MTYPNTELRYPERERERGVLSQFQSEIISSLPTAYPGRSSVIQLDLIKQGVYITIIVQETLAPFWGIYLFICWQQGTWKDCVLSSSQPATKLTCFLSDSSSQFLLDLWLVDHGPLSCQSNLIGSWFDQRGHGRLAPILWGRGAQSWCNSSSLSLYIQSLK